MCTSWNISCMLSVSLLFAFGYRPYKEIAGRDEVGVWFAKPVGTAVLMAKIGGGT